MSKLVYKIKPSIEWFLFYGILTYRNPSILTLSSLKPNSAKQSKILLCGAIYYQNRFGKWKFMLVILIIFKLIFIINPSFQTYKFVCFCKRKKMPMLYFIWNQNFHIQWMLLSIFCSLNILLCASLPPNWFYVNEAKESPYICSIDLSREVSKKICVYQLSPFWLLSQGKSFWILKSTQLEKKQDRYIAVSKLL